jgi:hypothetical protein
VGDEVSCWNVDLVDRYGVLPRIRRRRGARRNRHLSAGHTFSVEDVQGDFVDSRGIPGLKISNSATDFYKVEPPLGTWCAGIGGTAVKCSTEHYTVMEHVLSCHETVPYFFADPLTGAQSVRSFPDGTGEFDCADAGIDDELFIIKDGVVSGELLTSVTPGDRMDANDNTTVLNDIATSKAYSVTLKDDGTKKEGVLGPDVGLVRNQEQTVTIQEEPYPPIWYISTRSRRSPAPSI